MSQLEGRVALVTGAARGVGALMGDICASGGYYIAAAADRIYADKATVANLFGGPQTPALLFMEDARR